MSRTLHAPQLLRQKVEPFCHRDSIGEEGRSFKVTRRHLPE
jgi:hypothetical protein